MSETAFHEISEHWLGGDTSTRLSPSWRDLFIKALLHELSTSVHNDTILETIKDLLEGEKYEIPPLTDLRRLRSLIEDVLAKENYAALKIFGEHLTQVCKNSLGEPDFRKLDETHAQAAYDIEQAIIDKNPESMEKGQIHAKSLETFRALLGKDSPSTLIGRFANGKLIAYVAYVIPRDPRALFEYDEQVVARGKTPKEDRHISIPVAAANDAAPTGSYYLLRVDPACQLHGVATELCAFLIQKALGLREVSKDFGAAASHLVADVTADNLASVLVQFKAAALANSKAIISAAGYDAGAKYVPCVTITQTADVANEDMPALHSLTAKDAFGPFFDNFARVLDSGYVASIDFQGRDLSSWIVRIAERPPAIGEIRAEGELPAAKISVERMRELLSVDPVQERLTHIGADATGMVATPAPYFPTEKQERAVQGFRLT